MSSNISEATVQRVAEYLATAGPSTASEMSAALDIHSTVAGAAGRILTERGEAKRLKIDNKKRGQRPYLYASASDTSQLEMPTDEAAPEVSSDLNYRPGSVAARVAKYMSRKEVESRHTVDAVTKQFNYNGGTVARAAVLEGFRKLVVAGYLERTDQVRKNSDGTTPTYYRILKPVPAPENFRITRKKTSAAPAATDSSLEARVAELEAFVAKLKAAAR